MSKDKPLLVKGCPLCEIFLNPKENVKTKLYYPDSIEDINQETELVILDCISRKVPMIVYRDHMTSITREAWGRLLWKVRKILGNVTLRCEPRRILDHFHCYVKK